MESHSKLLPYASHVACEPFHMRSMVATYAVIRVEVVAVVLHCKSTLASWIVSVDV